MRMRRVRLVAAGRGPALAVWLQNALWENVARTIFEKQGFFIASTRGRHLGRQGSIDGRSDVVKRLRFDWGAIGPCRRTAVHGTQGLSMQSRSTVFRDVQQADGKIKTGLGAQTKVELDWFEDSKQAMVTRN